jgi:hypothetical protein
MEFLSYARMNNIIVLCYPSHSTHVLQGLDVACFSPLKRFYSVEKEKFERMGHRKVKKEDFLQLYAKAHICAFTEGNIKAAFAKTGNFENNFLNNPLQLLIHLKF